MPREKNSKDAEFCPKKKMKLKPHDVDNDHLTEVDIRLALRDAFVSRHYCRVWGTNTPDSFFRSPSIALMSPFDIQLILELIKLRIGLNECTLSRKTRAFVSRTTRLVQEVF